MEKIPELDNTEEKLYTPKEAGQKTNLGTETLRSYVDFFELQTKWTKPNNKGHRRFTKQNIETLITIRKMIQEQNYSREQVRDMLLGNEDEFVDKQAKSRLEDKMDQMIDNQDKQNDFYLALVQRLDRLEQQNTTILQENAEMRQFIKERDEARDQILLEAIRNTQEQNKKRVGVLKRTLNFLKGSG